MFASLAKPEMAYRPRNYWGWLENITPEETVWQIDRMWEAGLGGYVMHARGGLTMPYAGKQWMDSVRAMIERGRKYGMITIVDDEHGWPSGFGAGKVNGKGEKYWLKYLLSEEIAAGDVQDDPNTLGLWTLPDYSFVTDASALGKDAKLLRVYKKLDRYYVDNMDPDVVDAFIEASYEDYNREVGGDFGGDGVYGIFSDEPQTARYATPWTDILPELYEKTYGRPLKPEMHKLFANVPGCEAFRREVYLIMQACFVDNYAGRLYRWCEAHHVNFMGHTCLEEDFAGQLRCAIGTMPFYENMHVPGIDWLCRVPVSNLTILQLTSVAAQTGKKRVLCEMYGCAGWNVSFEELKWIAQWQTAMGVNDQLQHLGLYSLRGSRKREYPASLFYQQPWFDRYRPYNEYFARADKLVAESEAEIDLLLLHPMRAVWSVYDGTEQSTRPLQEMFVRMTDDLLSLNLAIHYGDETLLQKHGRVENGALRIGHCAYRTVLVPPVPTIDRATFALLEEFRRQGGRLVFAGDVPTMLDGAPTDEVRNLEAERIGADRASLAGAFHACVRVEPFEGENSLVYVARRVFEGKRFYYVTNNDLHNPARFRLVSDAGRALYEYDPQTNALSDAPYDVSDVRLDGAQAAILFEGDAPAPETYPAREVYGETIELRGDFTVKSVTDNALTLDFCELSFDGEQYEQPEYILRIQDRLIHEQKNRDVYLRFTFRADADMDVFLLVENPEKCAIAVNGASVDAAPEGWRVDKCLEALPIHARAGINTVVVKRYFENSERVYFVKNNNIHEAEANRVTVETELESVYLWGDFAVRNDAPETDGPRRTTATMGDFRIAPRAETADIERIERDGYPYFAGAIALSKTFTLSQKPAAARVAFCRPDAIVTKVSVNGVAAKEFLWAPYEADITDLLRAGENEIEIELVTSCRNLFGPHYSPEGDSYGIWPGAFDTKTKERHFVRLGVEGGARIEYR